MLLWASLGRSRSEGSIVEAGKEKEQSRTKGISRATSGTRIDSEPDKGAVQKSSLISVVE